MASLGTRNVVGPTRIATRHLLRNKECVRFRSVRGNLSGSQTLGEPDMQTTSPEISLGVRTVLHLSPAVCVAALSGAQQAGLTLQEWFEERVGYALAEDPVMLDEGLSALAPWSLAAADLFVQTANQAPETLSGRWALLYERVKLDRGLWRLPTQSVEDAECGEALDRPYVSLPKVRAAWPRLCASTFCL